MRHSLDGDQVNLEIGFFPATSKELEKAIKEKVVISIRGHSGMPNNYLVDSSRFSPRATTWLPLPLSHASDFTVSITPYKAMPSLWNVQWAALSEDGALFDCLTGRRVPVKGDVMVGKPYYYLTKRSIYFGLLQKKNIPINSSDWHLYKICVDSYSDTISDFFFSFFRVRLTTIPSNIEVVWPPVLERDDNCTLDCRQCSSYQC